MNLKPVTLLAFFCLAVSISFSQEALLTGYYLTTNGTRIQGSFPQFKKDIRNPDRVEFVSTDNKTTVLTPENTRQFRIDGYYAYIAYNGPRMINPENENLSSATTESSNRYDTIHSFLKVIYDAGDVALYSYQDNARENFFYQKKNEAIIELEQKSYLYTVNGVRHITSSNRFRDQLSEEFGTKIEQKNLKSKLGNLSYSPKSLVRFFDLLNGTSVAKQQQYNNGHEFFIGAGLAINSFSLTGRSSDYETGIDYHASARPAFVIGMTFHTKAASGKLFISPRLRVFSERAQGDTDITTSFSSSNYQSTFEIKTIINPTINVGYYLVNRPAFRWYVTAGPGVDFLLGNTETQRTKWYYNPSATTISPITVKHQHIIVSLNTETGVDFGKSFGLWLNYQPPVVFTNYAEGITAKYGSLQMGLGFSFGRRK